MLEATACDVAESQIPWKAFTSTCLLCVMDTFYVYCVIVWCEIFQAKPWWNFNPQASFCIKKFWSVVFKIWGFKIFLHLDFKVNFQDLKRMRPYLLVSKIFQCGQFHFSYFVSVLDASGQADPEDDEEAPRTWFRGPRWVAPRANEMEEGGGEQLVPLVALQIWFSTLLQAQDMAVAKASATAKAWLWFVGCRIFLRQYLFIYIYICIYIYQLISFGWLSIFQCLAAMIPWARLILRWMTLRRTDL